MRKRLLLILGICILTGASTVGAQWNWFWKAGYHDYCPEGVPDFDQKQDGWTSPFGMNWTYCGPVACLNSLWWFDSRYEPNIIPPPDVIDNFPLLSSAIIADDHVPGQVIPYVDELAWDMDTDGISSGTIHLGTRVTDMHRGLEDFLDRRELSRWNNRGCWFEVCVQPDPSFEFIYEEIRICHDVILLLGFWQEDSTGVGWRRTGGHYVTVAGVEPDRGYIAVCDPYLDMMCWNHIGPHGPGVHNNTQYVAHDIYHVSPFQFDPWSTPEIILDNYPADVPTPAGYIEPVENFLGQNESHWEMEPYWDPAMPVIVKVEYAIKVWPAGKWGGRVLDWAGWHLWSPYGKTPWIWPYDFSVVHEDTNEMVTVEEAATMGWLQVFIFGYGTTGYITYPGPIDYPYIRPGYGYWVLTYMPRLRIVARYDWACGTCCWWRQGPIIFIDHNPFG